MSLFDVPPPWTERAACATKRHLHHLPPQTWDDRLEWEGQGDSEPKEERAARHELARWVCRNLCDPDAFRECLASARRGEGGGVRADQVFPDKVADLTDSGPQRSSALHGTPARFRVHLKRGEKPCDACRLAWNVDQVRVRRERKDRQEFAAVGEQ